MSRRRRNGNHIAEATAGALTAGYVRVSKAIQAMSPAAQEERIREMAAREGSRLVELVTDKETAKEGSIHVRPGIRRILELIDSGQVNRIIVAKLDRLTRSVVDVGEILTIIDRKGVSLASTAEGWMDTGSAAGRMIINIMTSVAQWEREAISERTSAVLQYKKAHGQPYNHPVFGMRLTGKAAPGRTMAGKRLVADPQEQQIIARAKAMRKKGCTLQCIADKLNTEKIRTKGRRRAGQVERGKWYASTVRNILLG